MTLITNQTTTILDIHEKFTASGLHVEFVRWGFCTMVSDSRGNLLSELITPYYNEHIEMIINDGDNVFIVPAHVVSTLIRWYGNKLFLSNVNRIMRNWQEIVFNVSEDTYSNDLDIRLSSVLTSVSENEQIYVMTTQNFEYALQVVDNVEKGFFI